MREIVRPELMAYRRIVRATSLVLIIGLIVSLFPVLAASPASATPPDLAHTSPTGWYFNGGNAGMSVEGFGMVTDADDFTNGNMNVAPGQGCGPVGSYINCGISFNWHRTAGVMNFQLNALRMKFGYCAGNGDWPTFGTCGGSDTGVAVAEIEVFCQANWVATSVLLLTTGWNGTSEITHTTKSGSAERRLTSRRGTMRRSGAVSSN